MSADLALIANDPTSLDLYDDPGKQIVLACERANAWLKAGIEVRIETIVETKAQAAAIAAFAVQKQLGKDAELAALEVQRRAERGVGLAIRAGQERGEISKVGDDTRDRVGVANRVSPSVVAQEDKATLATGIYPVTDGISEDQFEAAIEAAKDERNLSRANVVRKVKGEPSPMTTAQKVERIREMADGGHASSQIAKALGHGEKWIRDLAVQHGITFPADAAVSRTRRIDSNNVMDELVATLDSLGVSMRVINLNDLDAARTEEWANSLTESIRALNRFTKQIKELAP